MIIEMRAFIPANKTEGYGAWGEIDPKNELGMMFYQRDQYLGSFLRRAHTMDAEKEHDAYETPGFKLMLWTNCKTKGVKIFEEDILLGVDKEPMIVQWHFNRFVYRVRGRIQEFNKLDFEAGFFTVAGNTFQNPELLK